MCNWNDPCVSDKQTRFQYHLSTNFHVLACSMSDIWAIFISCMLVKVRSETEMSSATWYWLPTFLTYIFLLIYFIRLLKIARKDPQCCSINWTGFVIFIFPKGWGSPFGNFSSAFSMVSFQIADTLLVSRCPHIFFPTMDLPGETPRSAVLICIWSSKFPWILWLTCSCSVVSNKSRITSSGISVFYCASQLRGQSMTAQ